MTYLCVQHQVRCTITGDARRYQLPAIAFDGQLAPPSCALLLASVIYSGQLPFLDAEDRPTTRYCPIEEVVD